MTYKAGAAAAAQKVLSEASTSDADDIFGVDTTHAVDPVKLHRSQADQQAFENLQRVFNDTVAAVKVSEPTRDVSQNQRFRYELNWRKLRAAARNYAPAAKVRGIKVMVPRYFPPINTNSQFVEFNEPEEVVAPPPRDVRSLPGSGVGMSASPYAGVTGADGKLTAPVTIHGVTFPAGSVLPTGV